MSRIRKAVKWSYYGLIGLVLLLIVAGMLMEEPTGQKGQTAVGEGSGWPTVDRTTDEVVAKKMPDWVCGNWIWVFNEVR